MMAPRAAQAGGRIWGFIYIAFRMAGGRRRELCVKIRIRLMSRADRIAAWRSAKRLSPDFGKGDAEKAAGRRDGAPRFFARSTEPAFMEWRHLILSVWGELRTDIP